MYSSMHNTFTVRMMVGRKRQKLLSYSKIFKYLHFNIITLSIYTDHNIQYNIIILCHYIE